MATATQTSPPPTQPNSPSSRANTAFYVSPHSSSRLRFPHSHTFPEWRRRCFRCCRTSHSVARCRNPKRCSCCWAYEHIGSKCKEEIVPPPQPTRPITKPALTIQAEPNFDELFIGSYPYRSPEMSDRQSPPSSTSSDSDNNFDENEVIPMNIDVLRELCQGRRAASLKLGRFAAIEEIDLDFTHMATNEMTTADQPAQSQDF